MYDPKDPEEPEEDTNTGEEFDDLVDDQVGGEDDDNEDGNE